MENDAFWFAFSIVPIYYWSQSLHYQLGRLQAPTLRRFDEVEFASWNMCWCLNRDLFFFKFFCYYALLLCPVPSSFAHLPFSWFLSQWPAFFWPERSRTSFDLTDSVAPRATRKPSLWFSEETQPLSHNVWARTGQIELHLVQKHYSLNTVISPEQQNSG